MIQIAHRGYSQLYGDNNMYSFQKALEHGFQMIELDIQMCSSGHIVVYHDIYIYNEYISDLPFSELSSYGIISLDQFFSEFAHTDILIFLDIKGKRQIIHEILDIIRKWFVPETMHRIFISSFDTFIIDPILNSNFNVRIGFTTSSSFSTNDLDIITQHCDFVCYHWTALDKSTVEYFKEKGILVFSYTCENKFIENHIHKYNVDGIVSNYPII